VVVEPTEAGLRHEVRGDRHTWREAVQDVALGEVLGQQRVGLEALVVQELRGVGKGGGEPGRQDVVPVDVALAPERRAPGVVEPFEVAVAAQQPVTERIGAGVAVARRVVAAVLVRDVPHGHGRMVVVAGRHLLGQPGGVTREDRRARTPRLARSQPPAMPFPVHRQRVGVRQAEPGGRGRGARREVDGDAAPLEPPEDVVEPVELERAVLGLQPRPGEDAETDEGDARAPHERDVLVPHLVRPLLGVVVPAEGDDVAGPGAHVGQSPARRYAASIRSCVPARPREPGTEPAGTRPQPGPVSPWWRQRSGRT